MTTTFATFSLGVASVALLSSCAQLGGTSDSAVSIQLKPASPAVMTSSCADLASKFNYAQVRVTSSAAIPAGAIATSGAPNAPKTAFDAPAHCLVKGLMQERKGADGKDYAIGFEMRLPTQWNGRFYYQANGGLDGVVQPALGALGGGPLTGALAQGFAVISSDAGHNGSQNPYFGAEPQSRQDYSYDAVAKLTPMAKGLIQTAYGKAPDRSYIGGCSNGGRHAMVAASRFADQYDGYLVGAPGYRLPNAALAQLWGSGLWNNIAPVGPTVNHPFNPSIKFPDIGAGFNADDRQIVANAVLVKCDMLDGANDGLVQDVAACQKTFDISRDIPTCTSGRDGKCLSNQQKSTISKVFSGAKTSSGAPVYASFPYDTGVAGSNWATWKFVFSQALDPGALSNVFTSPVRGLGREVKAFDTNIDELYAAIYAKPTGYNESADEAITPVNHANPSNMSAVQKRGAKMIMYHGVSDGVFSESDTRAWVDRVSKTVPKSDSFVRHFSVPGMNHCSGGPATDQFDALTPLVQWVEQGKTPQAIVANVRGAGNVGGVNMELPKDWSASRSRPLCAYPAVARYKGTGNIEDAANFSCQ
jgi:pimeloyl-ACP methyl ester carboxylesterase